MRIATRNDTAQSKEEKDRLSSLASTVMIVVDSIVQRAESQMQDAGAVLQELLKAAADERGEWQVPLSRKSYQALRGVMEARAADVDESLLATAYSYMKKAADDKMDGARLGGLLLPTGPDSVCPTSIPSSRWGRYGCAAAKGAAGVRQSGAHGHGPGQVDPRA